MGKKEKKKKSAGKQGNQKNANPVVLDNDERKMNKPVKGLPKV